MAYAGNRLLCVVDDTMTIWVAEYRKRAAVYASPESGWATFGSPMLMGWTHRGYADAFVRDKNEPGAYYDRSQFEWRVREYVATQTGSPRWFVGHITNAGFNPVAGAFDSKERAEGYRDTLFGDCIVQEYGPR